MWAPQLSCASYVPHSDSNINRGGYYNPRVDALAARATAEQLTDPAVARRLWASVDRMVTDDAPWVVGPTNKDFTLVSTRVGNYQAHPVLGPLIDQMWVR